MDTVEEVTGVSLLPRSRKGRWEQMVKMRRVLKQGLVAPCTRLLHKRRAPQGKGLKKTPGVLIVNSLLY